MTAGFALSGAETLGIEQVSTGVVSSTIRSSRPFRYSTAGPAASKGGVKLVLPLRSMVSSAAVLVPRVVTLCHSIE